MKDESAKDLDYVWFAGDVFDRIANLPQPEILLLHSWIGSFLIWCRENNIRLRILEGTPSHDRKQSKLFVEINELISKPADLRYIDVLCIDYEEDFDFHVLYVPDEWRHDPLVTWQEVLDEMRVKGLDKIDIGVMHGTMDFQVPKFINIPGVHNSNDYADITRWFITIGHQHVRSSYRNIYAQGSLDRLSQNEEAPKGHYRFLVDMDKDIVVPEFIVNKHAMPHRDVDVSGLPFDEAYQKATELAEEVLSLETTLEVRYYGYIRLSLSEKHYSDGLLSSLKEKYPKLSWDRKVITEKKSEDENGSMDFHLEEAIVMTPNNATGIIEEELALLSNDAEMLNFCSSLIEEVVCEN